MRSVTATGAQRDTAATAAEDLKQVYLHSLRHLERLHRLLLDVIRDEFERASKWDINSVQALLLYNIGDGELTAGELHSRGYYHGSNVTYNLKKLVAGGYIEQQRSQQDRRSVRIRLTAKGREACAIVDRLYERQIRSLEVVGGLGGEQLDALNGMMRKLERFWGDQIRFRL